MIMKKRGVLGALVLAIAAGSAAAAEVTLRHSLDGRNAALLIELVGRFNESQKSDKVVVQHVSGAAESEKLPDMALVGEQHYEEFFGTRPRMLPLQQAVTAGVRADLGKIYPVLADTVSDGKGRIEALPLAFSIPVLYFNKDAFRKVGLDADQPPRTWWKVQDAAGKLLESGYRCPFTSSRSEWVHVENLATQHGEALSSRERSGRTRLNFNSLVQVKHLALLASWHKSFYFHYFGRGGEADDKFATGECPMLTSGSDLYARLKGSAGFDVGMADLPYYDDVRDATPGRVLPDGAALRVLAGRKKAEYKVVGRFIAFLMKPEIQKEWVARSGYLPMTTAGAAGLGGDDAAAPVLKAAVKRLAEKRNVTSARVRVLPGFSRVRDIMNEELEAVWANRKPAKEALDTGVARGNAALAAGARPGGK